MKIEISVDIDELIENILKDQKLFEFMREHPQLCGARKKEPQFFSQLTGIIQLLINKNKI
jgi:hypothetical protein